MDPNPRAPVNSPSKSPAFITLCFATGLFSGYSPWASGTVGSVVGLLIFWIPGFEHPELSVVAILLAFVIGAVAARRVAQSVGHQLTPSAIRSKEVFQNNAHETPDPSIVVIDEIVGMWISLLLLPKSLWVSMFAFILFRIYDILKPPPCRQLERIPNGWGIMLDDVAAGILANISVRIVLMLLPTSFGGG